MSPALLVGRLCGGRRQTPVVPQKARDSGFWCFYPAFHAGLVQACRTKRGTRLIHVKRVIRPQATPVSFSDSYTKETEMPEQDNDLKKGAVVPDTPKQHSESSLAGQLPHRTEDARIKGRDTDFPEPGENPEHSGQDMDPGFRQKTNQNQKKDDPLAA